MFALIAFFLWAEAAPLCRQASRRQPRSGSQEGERASASLRTMADLMDRLGARSRFEAGLRVVELGWLD